MCEQEFKQRFNYDKGATEPMGSDNQKSVATGLEGLMGYTSQQVTFELVYICTN